MESHNYEERQKHSLQELPAWERLLKRLVFRTFEDVSGKRILDFGSGEGITANFFAGKNEVVAVEPRGEMMQHRWKDNAYEQICGSVEKLQEMADDSFDMVLCHNVLEYIDDKETVLKELTRVLRPGGIFSLIKHNRYGRVMQMAVLLDDLQKANDLLDGKDSTASKFGAIRYYEDDDVCQWAPELSLERCLGIRTFWDLQQNQEKHGDEDWQEKMMELDMRVSETEEFRRIAFFHHLILRKKSMTHEIQTKRLILRAFQAKDYDDLYEFLAQLEHDEFEGYPGITYENAKEHLRYRMGSDEFYAVVLKENGKVIGNIYFGKREFDTREAGYIINRDYQRMGYATEALGSVIENAFQRGVHRIYAECDPRNEASWRLLEKVGLKREAHLACNIYFHTDESGKPKWKDTYIYATVNPLEKSENEQ